MKKSWLLAIIILSLGLILSGCLNMTVETGTPHNSEPVDNASDETKEQSEQEKLAVLLKEREELEIKRKEGSGEFYVPLPQIGQESEIKTVKAKAIYLTANVAGFDFSEEDVKYYAEYIKSISGQSGEPADTSRMDDINKLEKALAICESTEINSLVIDIKNDDGLVAWNSDIEIVNNVKSNWVTPLKNYERLLDYLKENDIYSIARIVAFKDPYFSKVKIEHAIQLKAGGVYKDGAGMTWVNPFDEYVWKYLVAISQEAALRGFDEIQYDYVRFPDSAAYYNPITEFPGRNDRDKDEGIEEFLEYAGAELKPYNVHMSADVFGVITRSWDDKPEDIGQTWRKIANQVEYICPMIYPSHYGTGIYGFKVPDQYPYEVARSALIEAIERNAAQKSPGIIRPWFQGFNAPWVKGYINYDAEAISDQMVAGMELGIDEYIIWNASCNYEPMSFFYDERINKTLRENGEDILFRTPELTLKKYLDAQKAGKYSILYLLTPIGERQDDYDRFVLYITKNQHRLKKYDILNIIDNGDGTYKAKVSVEYDSDTETSAVNEAGYKIILENDVYKVLVN